MKLKTILIIAFALLVGGGVGYIAMIEVPIEQEQTRIDIPIDRFLNAQTQ